jgi:hypothetical protein
MPITFSYDTDKNFVNTLVAGPLADSDPVDHLGSVLAHPAFRPGFSALVLCEQVTLRGFSTRSVESLAKFTREIEPQLLHAKVAVVTTQRPVYGLVRMYQLIRRPAFELALFRDAGVARSWLSRERRSEDSG